MIVDIRAASTVWEAKGAAVVAQIQREGGGPAAPLRIKRLKGEEPVESIDLSSKGLKVASAVVIAGLISTNAVTKSIKSARRP